jgi:hypothetical protein
VGVGDPRIGSLGAANEVPQPRACCGPEAEGPIDVQPGTVLGCCVSNLVERIEGAGVHVARLRTHDRRPVSFTQCVA